MSWQGEVFKGKIGFTMEDSTPDWNLPPRPPAGSPNVLMIVLDDVGYGHLGCYGSPIETPNIDALAARGLRYTNWHTTAMCSPTRSCLLTGRNHHSNGMGMISELASGYPGYDGMPQALARLHLGDAAASRAITHLCAGQVAPSACRRNVHGRAVHSLAAGQGLRSLLRLPRRGDRSIQPRSGVRQSLRRAAHDARKKAITSPKI